MTEEQLSIYDYPGVGVDPARAGERLRDIALERVERNADETWLHAAVDALAVVAYECAEFTSDDVWAKLEAWNVKPPREPRAMGAIIKNAARDGLCRATDEWRLSERPGNHRRPVRVWKAAA